MRFLIAGLGSIGRRHLKNLVALGQSDIVLLRSKLSTQPDEELKEFPVETDLQHALTLDPDAVIISNPTVLHLDVAISAANAGCSLFLEKPISHNLERTQELKSAVESKGVCAFVGFQFRFHPGLKKIKELIDNAAIGRILYVRCSWGEFLPDWHPWEDYRRGYSARKDLGGGVVLTLCHPIDYWHWLLGEMTSLFAHVEKLGDLEIEVEDTAEIIMKFTSGALGSLHLDYLQQPAKHTLEITGTLGIIHWDYSDGAVYHYINASRQWHHDSLTEVFSRNDLFLAEMKHFIGCVEGSQLPLCTLDDGIYAQRIIDAVYRSSQTHSIVKI
jgi:predicted dehydrogenase